MNTEIEVLWPGPDLRPWFAQVERTLSRFDPGSALSALNLRQGSWQVVPRLLYVAVAAALRAAADTEGAFDPTVLPALEASGYSRSFDLGPTPPGTPVPGGRWREVRLNASLRAIWLPLGLKLDLGGIGKGLAVDLAMRRLKAEPQALVNAGGDLAVRTAPGVGPVLIEVQDPWRPGSFLATFRLHKGAVATSSTLGRRWGPGLHHLIDPASGLPADTDVVAATVVAGRAAHAEVLAKACIIRGREQGLRLLAQQGCRGLLITDNGDLIATPNMEGMLDEG